MDKNTPKWLAPVVLGGAGTICGLVYSFSPGVRTGLDQALRGPETRQAIGALLGGLAGTIATSLLSRGGSDAIASVVA
ncbi:hypothetical protein [Leifsonia sp. Root112D2]|uniref:hypothetical protein n=1 Tax=Leifsonia sp. Root112D2 TaxID=1736426 RepID=UPI000B1D8D84|nr:hypothetical protein [Leifsonia sp. Root112D2]